MLGAGTAGIVASTYAAGLGARVALVERGLPGGDCLFTGCVPSKNLLAAARLAHSVTSRPCSATTTRSRTAPSPTGAHEASPSREPVCSGG